MIYVYCHFKSCGARDLAKGLGAVRLRNFDGLNLRLRGRKVTIGEKDHLVCWGSDLPDLDVAHSLNKVRHGNKLKAIFLMQGNGVPTVTAMTRKVDGWVPRRYDHVGGNDLLRKLAPEEVNFWVKWEPLVAEYRVHSFQGKSIRAGRKVPREGFCMRKLKGLACPECGTRGEASSPEVLHGAHPEIRAWDAGWNISYVGVTPNVMGLAHKAVKTLGLDFGAVDIGERADGSLIVLEVNRAPGIEGGTLEKYVAEIKKWSENSLLRAV